MAVKKKTTPVRRRRRTTAKKTTPVRRRRRRTKKKGMGDLFSRSEAEAGFKQLVGVGAGFIAGEELTQWINPNGDKNQLEIISKLGGGYLISTTGRMPSLGAGMMASGVKKIWELKGMNDMGQNARINYLQDEPEMISTGITLNDEEINYLEDYAPGYQSNQY